MFNVCTFRGNFHLFLSSLGKTRLTQSEKELMGPYHELVRGNDGSEEIIVNATAQPLFLYEISQLSDKNATRASALRKDLQYFLELDQPISPMIWFKPGRNQSSIPAKKMINERKIDICESKYGKNVKRAALISFLPPSGTHCPHLLLLKLDDIRGVLMEQAVNTSLWIRQYFVHSPTVTISSKDYFVNELMPSWERDPCLARRQETVTQH
jgi:hypothetical protein